MRHWIIEDKTITLKRYRNKYSKTVISTLFIVFAGVSTIHAQTKNISQVTFYVLWYDVGKAALEGLKGIIKVEKGFKGFREINKVYYDPTLITIEEMKEALKRAKTYDGTPRSEIKN